MDISLGLANNSCITELHNINEKHSLRERERDREREREREGEREGERRGEGEIQSELKDSQVTFAQYIYKNKDITKL